MRNRVLGTAAAFATLVILCSSAVADQPYFVGLGHLPDSALARSYAFAVSDDGRVVVGYGSNRDRD